MKYIITESDNGKTVKDILKYELRLSMAHIKHLKFIENGITLNGEHATVRRTVTMGDVLELATEDTQDGSRLTPTDIALEIVFEDEHIVIPNKPPFMPTHPSHLHHGDTLADALAFRYGKQNIPFVFRPINRLDRNTSGLTLIAKSRISAAALSKSMQNGMIKKQYLAILECELDNDEDIIETHITRTDKSIIVRRVCSADEGGDLAITHYKVIHRSNGYTLVLASPVTGRTHQLRVHFAHIGHPIVGDDIYGHENPMLPRHALHAIRLKLPHPEDSRELIFSAPLPEDMCTFIEANLADFSKEKLDSDFGLN